MKQHIPTRANTIMPALTKSKGSMKLSIKDDLKLVDVQSEFHSYFQYLKIEFFKNTHSIGEGSVKSMIFEKNKYVRDCRIIHEDSDFIFPDTITVGEFEEHFQKVYGLSIQIFRKSGNVWIETSATDGWTLRQQNNEGAELSGLYND